MLTSEDLAALTALMDNFVRKAIRAEFDRRFGALPGPAKERDAFDAIIFDEEEFAKREETE